MKAVDTRLKEMKLTRTYVTEDNSKATLEVSRNRRKDRSVTRDNNRVKQKMFNSLHKLRNYRKRSRIRKNKKRIKDEDDLRIVEERFFEIVEKVISQNLPKNLAMFLA